MPAASTSTGQGHNQYRRCLMQARYNSSTGKLDFSSEAILDADVTPDQHLGGNFFAGFCGTDKVILAKQPTSTTTGLRFYVQTLATFSAGNSPIGSAGSTVTFHNLSLIHI